MYSGGSTVTSSPDVELPSGCLELSFDGTYMYLRRGYQMCDHRTVKNWGGVELHWTLAWDNRYLVTPSFVCVVSELA